MGDLFTLGVTLFATGLGIAYTATAPKGVTAGWVIAAVGVAFIAANFGVVWRASDAVDTQRDSERRAALKHLLGLGYNVGSHMLRQAQASEEQLGDWAERIATLIEAALGLAEAVSFGNDTDSVTTLFRLNPKGDWIRARQAKLDALLARFDRVPLRPDFDPSKWTDYLTRSA